LAQISITNLLSERFDQAFIYASRLHARQTRKRTPVPYIAHLLSVTALVLEDGGGEDEAIAALLHDAVEDQGGRVILEEIRRRFGEEVARIVDGCTDAYTSPKPPWRERKEQYIVKLLAAPQDIFRVSLADKLHNARTTVSDLRIYGVDALDKFNGGKNGTIWYYQTLLQIYQDHYSGYMVDELGRVVAEMKALAEI
jgi:(p)ppGpp synthase/HD superfamily hydrolase